MVNFGEILDKWEKKNTAVTAYQRDAAAFRDEEPSKDISIGERRNRLRKKKPDAFVDLHGLTRDEAWTRLETFFEGSHRKGYEKVLIIHGKGNHSAGDDLRLSEAVLKELTKHFIERCSFAGESGYNPAKGGGTGATWVILKE